MSFLNDWNEVQAESGGDFELIPEGDYRAQITDVSVDATKTPARLSMTLEIEDDAYRGRKLWSNYNLQGRGLGFLKKDLKTLSIDYSNVTKESDLMSIIMDASPVICDVHVIQKEYKGKTYNNVYINGRLKAKDEIPF